MKRATMPMYFMGAAITLGGCAASLPVPPAQAIHDMLIVPGVRIGPAALGMTEADMLAWMGEPTPHAVSGHYKYESEGLMVSFGQRPKAVVIQLWDSGRARSYATSEGIALGTSEVKLRATWTPVARRTMGPCADSSCQTMREDFMEYCFSNGIFASVDTATHRIVRMNVFPAGDDCW